MGPIGYRLGSGTWRDSWQVPNRAAALGALFFLGYAAKAMLLNAPRPQMPPAWILATAGLALASWPLAVARSRQVP